MRTGRSVHITPEIQKKIRTLRDKHGLSWVVIGKRWGHGATWAKGVYLYEFEDETAQAS